jgi:hypothetical protein
MEGKDKSFTPFKYHLAIGVEAYVLGLANQILMVRDLILEKVIQKWKDI